jgi:hypothetical protein
MKPIAIFYHSVFCLGNPTNVLPGSLLIARDQMENLKSSGLLETASALHIGVNGGRESEVFSRALFPENAKVVYHGLDCRNENLTLTMLERWLPDHPDWHVLYFHTKGATHPPGHLFSSKWRNCMMKHLVSNWRECVKDLETHDAVGCHWMEPPATPPSQFIFAGNFWWATSNFLRTLPSIYERDRIKVSGIGNLDSRYESEVWIGNGPKPPKVKDYHGPNWNPSKIETCA